MKVEARGMKIGGLLLAVLIISVLAAYRYQNDIEGKNGLTTKDGNAYALAYPMFAQSVNSEASFLDEEAGISIYLNAGRAIDLSKAKAVYRTIEKEDANYVIGSIALPNLSESEDPHCFVHREGWIVVYYLKDEPVAKIVDWSYFSGGQLTTNKLQVGLEKMCNALGLSISDVRYCHFQYPFANKFMVIIKTGKAGTYSFRIMIPDEFIVYEHSWSHHSYVYSIYETIFKIDENIISSLDKGTTYGRLLASQLSPGIVHTVSIHRISNYLHGVCIALVYKEP